MKNTKQSNPKYGWLCDYATGNPIRLATKTEFQKSLEAASLDGGAGVIVADGQKVYVSGESAQAHDDLYGRLIVNSLDNR